MAKGSDTRGLVRAGEILSQKHMQTLREETAQPQQQSLLEPAMGQRMAPANTGSSSVKRLARSVNPEIFTDSGLIRAEDILYVHSIFLQCFMPIRHNAKNGQRWETGNRQAKLVIRAGELVNPNNPGEFKQCLVPAGPKARIVTAYINDYAYRHGPEIDLADSMREFMSKAGIPIGGKNGKELQRELENLAAADIYLGIWQPGVCADQKKVPVSDEFTFWIDKDPRQGTLWKQKMVLSARYYQSIMQGQHLAPIYWPAYRALQHSPRAMDIFVFLSYRLCTIPFNKPVILKSDVLHAMFGRDIQKQFHFWPRFLAALNEAASVYQTARIEVLSDAVRFWHSPPIIPYKKSVRLPQL
jgi:hypothetical protein